MLYGTAEAVPNKDSRVTIQVLKAVLLDHIRKASQPKSRRRMAERVGFYASRAKPKELAAFSFVPNKALALERPQAPRNALPAYTR